MTPEKEMLAVPRYDDRARRARAVALAALFLALLGLCWLFPLTGDDWFREDLGLGLHSLRDLVDEVIRRWQTTNGRILGNVLAYSAGGRKALREVLRAAITLAAAALVHRHWGRGSPAGLQLYAAALLALPRVMFREIYPWAAGFFNYVPPVALLLAALWLVEPVLDGKPLRETPLRALAVGLLGFCGQLFIENNTLYALCAAFALLVWYGWRQRRLSPVLLAFLLGTVLGAALLFASPSYGLIDQAGGAYQSDLSHGLSGLLATARANQREVLTDLISGCPVLFLSLTGLGLAWFARSAKGWPDKLAAAGLVLGCGCFALGRVTELPNLPHLAAVLLWELSLGTGCWRWLPRGGKRARALFFWGSAAVAAFPLLFVSPIGPRCLYLSYVLLLLTAGNLLSGLLPTLPPRRTITAGAAVVLAAVFVFYLRLFLPIHRWEAVRTAALESALAAGETSVTLPAYPNGDYLWDGDSLKIQYRYYYETPGDLAVTFVPEEEWNGAG
jgi:hypothetical protein